MIIQRLPLATYRPMSALYAVGSSMLCASLSL